MNGEMKHSGIAWIGNIPKDWDSRRLKSLGYLYGGLSGKSGEDFNVNEETDLYSFYIPFTNIFNNTVVQIDTLHKVKVERGEKQNAVQKGDILFLMSQNLSF